MGWVHDSGYAPAYAHEGWAAVVLHGGEDTATHDETTLRRMLGWRAACDCGWRGDRLYDLIEVNAADPVYRAAVDAAPAVASLAPESVTGEEGGGPGICAEWEEHLRSVLPGLAVHDAAQAAEKANRALEQAVQDARAAGASWTVIGDAAGLTRQSAYQRWSPNSDRASKTTKATLRSIP